MPFLTERYREDKRFKNTKELLLWRVLLKNAACWAVVFQYINHSGVDKLG